MTLTVLKPLIALGLAAIVTGCSGLPDIASRNAPFESRTPLLGVQPETPEALPKGSFQVVQTHVEVPRSLSVSEANTFYPRGDIVWRGDPVGDRHQQIAAIFESAVYTGTHDMAGDSGVILDIEVIRFHSLTEKSRYSVGGVHNMHFVMTVRDAQTGKALRPAQNIVADLRALGGKQALEADRKGQTQKVRVTGYLAQVIRSELETPSLPEETPRVAMIQREKQN